VLERLEKESNEAGSKIKVKNAKEMRIALNNKQPLCIHNETIERDSLHIWVVLLTTQ